MTGQALKVAALTIALGAAWLVGAGAQDKSPVERKAADKAAMQLPAPGPEMERLKFLLGNWDMNAEYLKSPMIPEGGKQTGWYKAQLGPGGFSIVADFEAEGPLGKEIGHQILSWDPKQSAYVVFTVGNDFPGAVTGTARWDGENLVTETQFDEAGVTMHMRSAYSSITEKSTHIEESLRGPDGSYQVIWKADATKQ